MHITYTYSRVAKYKPNIHRSTAQTKPLFLIRCIFGYLNSLAILVCMHPTAEFATNVQPVSHARALSYSFVIADFFSRKNTPLLPIAPPSPRGPPRLHRAVRAPAAILSIAAVVE